MGAIFWQLPVAQVLRGMLIKSLEQTSEVCKGTSDNDSGTTGSK